MVTITDVLLDVDIVVDVCAGRESQRQLAQRALRHAEHCGHRLWLSVASVQSLIQATAEELRRQAEHDARELSSERAYAEARQELAQFAAGRHWLAALAEDGLVFQHPDCLRAQLMKAVSRLGDNARLLTRDIRLAAQCGQALLLGDYLAGEWPKRPIALVDLQKQLNAIRHHVERNIHRVLHHGQFIMGPEVLELESQLAHWVGVRHAVACSSGTDALLMVLMAYGIGPGDAVFTTPFTFVATAEVIALLRATPVFVDIDPHTLNIDPRRLDVAVQRIEDEGTLRPRAVIPVDLFGLPADYDSIRAVARSRKLFVLEDAAQSFGALYKGRAAGSLGDAAATSFFPAKPLGCYGDGGAVFTDDDALADTLRSIRIHGQGMHQYDNVRVGLNGREDTLQAAILLAKLQAFPEEVEARQVIAERYTAGLKDRVETIAVPDGYRSAWSQYSIMTDQRDQLRAVLGGRGIPAAIYYPKPLHLQAVFADLGYVEGDLPVAESVAKRILSLPMHPYLDEETQQYIIDTVRDALAA